MSDSHDQLRSAAVSPSLRERALGWLRATRQSDDARRLQWNRVGYVLLGVMVAGYVGVAAGVFALVHYGQKLEDVSFADILVPSHWGRYRVALGDRAVAEARKNFEARRYREALMFAQAGISRSPGNRAGRLLLAQLLSGAQRTDAARQTLLDGLPYHPGDPDYVRAVLTFLLQHQEDGRVIAVARKLLPTEAANLPVARLLALGAATASYFRGDYDQAEDFLRRVPALGASREGRLLIARIEWERGFRELALIGFRQLAREQPGDAEVHQALVEHLRRQGLTDEARRSSVAFQIAQPALAAPRIELLAAYHDAAEAGSVAREVEALLRDFADDPSALLALAGFAANSGDAGLARRIASHVEARHLSVETFSFFVVEALIVARDYRGALDAIQAFKAGHPDWGVRYHHLFGSLQAVAYLGLGEVESSRLFFADYLAALDLRAENLLALANRCAALDGGEMARRILARAVEIDPLNQAALTRLVELDLELNRIAELPRHLRRLLTMRRPSPDILRVAQRKLGSDLFLFAPDAPAALEAVRAALARTSVGATP